MPDIARTEPSAEARVFAKQTRQLFAALLLEGFNERQALHIIGVMLAAAVAKGGDEDG